MSHNLSQDEVPNSPDLNKSVDPNLLSSRVNPKGFSKSNPIVRSLTDPVPSTSTPFVSPIKRTGVDLITENHIRSIFNDILVAALTNRDTVLREVRECVKLKDEQRCKSLSKHIHSHWKSLTVRNGIVFVNNKMAIPNVIKKAVVDQIHASHPESGGMTEMGQKVWWPFSNRDLINKARTCKPCTEIGKPCTVIGKILLVRNFLADFYSFNK